MRAPWKLAPVLALLVGCYGGVESEDNPVPEEERPWPTQAAGPRGQLDPTHHCPVRDDAVDVVYEERPDGAALVFRTSQDVPELQRSVRALANGYMRHEERPMHWSTHRPPTRAEGPGQPIGPFPEGEVTVQELSDGARLVVSTSTPEDTQDVRRMLRQHQGRFARGECLVPQPAGNEGAT